MPMTPRATWCTALRGRNNDALLVTTDGTIWLGGDVGLQAFRPNGRRQTRIRGKAAVAALPDGALIVHDAGGVERWDNPAGDRSVLRYAFDRPHFLGSAGFNLAYESGAEVHLFDPRLACIARFPSPEGFDVGWFRHALAADGMFCCGSKGLQVCDWIGQVRTLAPFPGEQVLAAVKAYGRVPVWTSEDGTEVRLTDPGKLHDLSSWVVTADADPDLLFACNRLAPFVAICFTREGAFRWCRTLGGACCGNRIHKDGNTFVASTGCGGTVVWFDRDGNVGLQTPLPTTPGLGHILSPSLIIPGDGSVHADGLRGLWSFDARGRDRTLPIRGSWHHDPITGRLLCVSGRTGWTRRIWPQSLAAYPLDVAWQA